MNPFGDENENEDEGRDDDTQNPFENKHENNPIIKHTNVELLLQINGRRSNTYISGLDLETKELDKHLKNLRIICACSCSSKTLKDDKQDIKVIHIQGNNISKIQEYLIKEFNIKNPPIRNYQSK